MVHKPAAVLTNRVLLTEPMPMANQPDQIVRLFRLIITVADKAAVILTDQPVVAEVVTEVAVVTVTEVHK